jgi:hypothetical protein
MPDIYRPSVPVGECTTLVEASEKMKCSSTMLIQHRRRGTEGFPNPVARFGRSILYVESELEAFYKTMCWRQADKSIQELIGG